MRIKSDVGGIGLRADDVVVTKKVAVNVFAEYLLTSVPGYPRVAMSSLASIIASTGMQR